MWSSQGNTDYSSTGKYILDWPTMFFESIFHCIERSAHSVSQPINMPNRPLDMTAGYIDPHSAVFSPKSTDPTNLGVNMCMNILDGDNSPRVKDNTTFTKHENICKYHFERCHCFAKIDVRLTIFHFRLTVIMIKNHMIIQTNIMPMMVNPMKQ